MSARYSWNSANVTISSSVDADGALPGVNVVVRNGAGRLRTGMGDLIRERSDVVSSERLAEGHWLTTFANGEVWDVILPAKGCSACG